LSGSNRTLWQTHSNSTALTYKQDSVCKNLWGYCLPSIAVCRFLPLPPLRLPYRFMGASFFSRFHICHCAPPKEARRFIYPTSVLPNTVEAPVFCSSMPCPSVQNPTWGHRDCTHSRCNTRCHPAE